MSDRGDVPRHDYDRIPYLVVFDDLSAYQDTYGGRTESVVLESYLLRPCGVP